MQAEPVVIDTNVVLDLLVFRDPAARPIETALAEGRWRWLATQAMRDELARVLAYPRVAPRVAFYQLQAQDVLVAFDRLAVIVEAPPKAPVTCADADDQGWPSRAAPASSARTRPSCRCASGSSRWASRPRAPHFQLAAITPSSALR